MEAIKPSGSPDMDGERFLSEVETGYTHFRDSDVAIAKITPCFENGKRALFSGLTNGLGFGTTELIVLRPVPDQSTSGFLYWLCASERFMGFGEGSMYGTGGQKRVPDNFVKDVLAAVPPKTEQKLIARFLDVETRRIDALYEEQQRLIELLKEKRQAAISHAVTKGISPDAQMKESGVEWLGEIPGQWEVIRIKWVAEVQSGHTPDKKIEAYWEGGDIPWVSLNDTGYLRDNDFITETAYYTTPEGIANSSARLLPAEAVVFSRDATIGRCAITTRPMAVSQHFIAWICGNRVIPEYLLRVCDAMLQELERLSTGATIKTIGMPDIGALVMPLPSIAEQNKIVQHIQAEIRGIDALIVEAESARTLLEERRAALISAAVTGKIDIRDCAPAEPAELEEAYEPA
jgi:type I restriction enzyme S subunit